MPHRFDSLYGFHSIEEVSDKIKGVIACVRRINRALDSAAITVHHCTKGSQADKDVIDLASGHGVLMRQVDGLLGIRPHAEEDHYSLHAEVRSLLSIDARVMKREGVLWVETDLDPENMKRPKGNGRVYTDVFFTDVRNAMESLAQDNGHDDAHGFDVNHHALKARIRQTRSQGISAWNPKRGGGV